MSLPGEPKNGDFASYVEALGRTGMQAPGQVVKPTRAEKKTRRQAIAHQEQQFPDAVPGGPQASQWDTGWGRNDGKPPSSAKPVPRPQRGTPGGFAAGSPEASPQLAKLASHRRVAFVMTIIAALLAWNAVSTVIEALSNQPVQMESFFPAVFWGFVSLMLFKSARGLRAKARQGALPQYGKLDSLNRRDGG
ncbi:Uncharacterised protein [Bordetella ansorpii]|uniref:Uncharacterized protein n=1 Tax=Bordetella ansorpii TaxID=288768 RepID=A0A157REV0_9BORD|nr:hypothetical protein [Bordetella ansorpii]SAI56522.1 Uncharacterised protein [Bordetella ansorpii]